MRPLHLKAGKQVTEKGEALQVNIGVGDAHRQILDGDDEHMRVGGAEVVLQNEAASPLGRRRGKTGMTELQRRSRVNSAMKARTDDFLIAEIIDVGDIHGLGGDRRLLPVERLVNVHNEEMETVPAGRIGRGEGIDGVARQHIVPCCKVRMGGKPFPESCRLVILDWGDHRLDGRQDARQQVGGGRNAVGVFGQFASALDNPVESRIVDASGKALPTQLGNIGLDPRGLGRSAAASNSTWPARSRRAPPRSAPVPSSRSCPSSQRMSVLAMIMLRFPCNGS